MQCQQAARHSGAPRTGVRSRSVSAPRDFSTERWLPIDSRNPLRLAVQVLLLILLVVAACLCMGARFVRAPQVSVIRHHVMSPPVGNDGGSDVVLCSNEAPRRAVATSAPVADERTIIA